MARPTKDLEESLFGLFADIKRDYGDTPVTSYYDTPFYEFSGPHSLAMDWDLDALTSLALGKTQAETVLEVCSGSGRIVSALIKAGLQSPIVGLDNSQAAVEDARRRLFGRSNVRFELVNVLDVDSYELQCGLAILGGLSINSFFDRDSFEHVLSFLTSSVHSDGGVVVTCYADAIAQVLGDFRDGHDIVQFSSSRHERLVIWRGIHYEEATGVILQNYFLPGVGADTPRSVGTLGVLRERWWTEREIAEYASKLGYSKVGRKPLHIRTGGGDGWPVVQLLFRRDQG